MKKENFKIENIPAVLYGGESENLYLFIHGRYSYKEEAEQLAQTVVPADYRVLSFDLPEHGERKEGEKEFTVQNCVADLKTVVNYVSGKYKNISLYACSIGAYFSLTAFQDISFRKCLFVSPVLDMERLIQNMMVWAGVTEDELKLKKVIETSFGETLSWDYYQFVKNNPVDVWESETYILYGEKDNLTEQSVLKSFKNRYSCNVRIMPDGEHYFHTPEQLAFLNSWLKDIAL